MAAVGALLAAVVCVGIDGLSDFASEVCFSLAVVFAFTAAGNAYNDYFDREGKDRMAKGPHRQAHREAATVQSRSITDHD
jgi:4-hydroxybenzoate polyprenyltransferase